MSLEYKILKASMPSMLENFVRDDISRGWVPLGGIAVEAPKGSFNYYQAMVRETYEDVDDR